MRKHTVCLSEEDLKLSVFWHQVQAWEWYCGIRVAISDSQKKIKCTSQKQNLGFSLFILMQDEFFLTELPPLLWHQSLMLSSGIEMGLVIETWKGSVFLAWQGHAHSFRHSWNMQLLYDKAIHHSLRFRGACNLHPSTPIITHHHYVSKMLGLRTLRSWSTQWVNHCYLEHMGTTGATQCQILFTKWHFNNNTFARCFNQLTTVDWMFTSNTMITSI